MKLFFLQPFIFTFLFSAVFSLVAAPSAHALFNVDDETLDQKVQRLETQERLGVFQILTEVPSTFANAAKRSVRRDELGKWFVAGALTGPLLYYDQDLYVQSMKLGRMWGLSNTDNLKPYGTIGDFTIMWGPSDASSALYFLGDGWIHVGGALALMGYGYFGDHTRPFNTAVEMINGFLCSTIFEQTLKRAFGREGPAVASSAGGTWRPFASNGDYDREKTRHDAFPSGHVMTTTLSFTVLRGNYPEYDKFLWPLQIVTTTALSFGMMNNGNHWASDYPIGIVFGYFFARAALQMPHSKKTEVKNENQKTAFLEPQLMPGFDQLTNEPTANLRWDF